MLYFGVRLHAGNSVLAVLLHFPPLLLFQPKFCPEDAWDVSSSSRRHRSINELRVSIEMVVGDGVLLAASNIYVNGEVKNLKRPPL